MLPRKKPLSCAVFEREQMYIEYKYLTLSALSFWSFSVYNVINISLQDGKILNGIAKKNTGHCFSIKSKATCKNSGHLDDI